MSALASQCKQHCSVESIFAGSGYTFSVIVKLGPVLVKERRDKRHQHLIHVRLTDQVSLYNDQICRRRFFTSAEGPGKLKCMEPMFDPYIKILWNWRDEQ